MTITIRAEPAAYLRRKARFAKRMLWERMQRQPRICPYCGPSSQVRLLTRKKFIMDIVECTTCELIFRWPKDTDEYLDAHYQDQYEEEAPQVRLPDAGDLPALKAEGFTSLFGPDLNFKMGLIKAIRPAGRILDYGCSWGYATYLMRQNGYSAVGFDVSKPRAGYAREHLGVPVIDSLDALDAHPSESFDIIYSNNVLEHLPSIGRALASFGRLLKRDGIAIHVLPNFSGKPRRTGEWLNWIGEDHPIAPTVDFFRKALPAAGLGRFAFATTPLDEQAIAAATALSGEVPHLDGDELLVVAQK
jgi:2-polyprenyl-3-methyl-5-hydroxy-6-metoxy-1,4-benzoquinol methylase